MLHFILGTRAQLIKIAPLMVECRRRGIEYNFVFLAQHKETMYEMMDMFQIKKPDYILGDIGKDITSAVTMFLWSIGVLAKGAMKLNDIFKGDKNGIAIVHGDAPPLLLGAILAKLYGLRVAHVEAGLRSFNFSQPFPEEPTRVLTWRLGLVNYYFCQNKEALQNVRKFGGKKFNTRLNTLLDSWALAKKASSRINADTPKGKYAIVTIHRFETISKRKQMQKLVRILTAISKRMHLLFILHPPTRASLKKFDLFNLLKENKNIELRPRYSFFEFTKLVYGCEFLISDGGSNQEESFYIGKPCLLLRYTTERTEGVGKNVVISKFDEEVIDRFVQNYEHYRFRPQKSFQSPSKFIIDKLEKERCF